MRVLRSTVEGLGIGVAAVLAMLAVAVAGAGLALSGVQARAGAAVVALAVGAPVDVALTGAVPGSDRLPVRGGLPVSVSGSVEVMPLGVTLVGVAVLVLLCGWRRSWPVAGGALVGFVVGVGWCARLGRGGPVDVEAVSFSFRAGVASAVLGAVVIAGLALGACLLPRAWRRAVAAVAVALGCVAALGTIGGVVAAVFAGGTRVIGVALLGGANAVGLAPRAFGVPWDLDTTGPIAEALRERLLDGALPGWQGPGPPVALAVAVLATRWHTTERGWPTAARLGAAWALGLAAAAGATGVSATATATVFVISLPAAEIALRGNVFVALLIGGAAGTLVGLLPPLRVWTHGIPARRRR